MDTVMMSVTRVTKTLIEVPAYLSDKMRVDEALSRTGRCQGINALIGSTFGMGMKGQMSTTTVKEHKYAYEAPQKEIEKPKYSS